MAWPLAIGMGIAGIAGGLGSYLGGEAAAEAASRSGLVQADMQFLQLMYLANIEKTSNEIRDQALNQLAVQYGLPGAEGAQFPGGRPPTFEEYRSQLIPQLQDDPFFKTLQAKGEEAVLRGASATGGLRSGGTSEALAENTQDVLMGLYDRRTQEYLTQQQGLMNLAGLTAGGLDTQIGQTIADIGQTRAQSMTAAAEARQRALESGINLGLKGIQLGMMGYQI